MAGGKVKMAVIGVGHMGRFHAEKISALREAELVAVVDTDQGRAEEIARSLGTRAAASHEEILDNIDAAVIAAPTWAHARIAGDLLLAGKDVLCEKPLAATLEEADHLVRLVGQQGSILQVGHVERFNPAAEGLLERGKDPLFIEASRIAPFKGRALDVDVPLDLMTHDLDIILALVGEEPCEIRATGAAALGSHLDIVNARLEFPSGCVANITASRLALKDERKMRVFQADAYMSVDFRERELRVLTNVKFRTGSLPEVTEERPHFARQDPLEAELKSFVRCIMERMPPRVGGEQGRTTLKVALQISEKARLHLTKRKDLLSLSSRLVESG
jgi:predicted dehydrogenase